MVVFCLFATQAFDLFRNPVWMEPGRWRSNATSSGKTPCWSEEERELETSLINRTSTFFKVKVNSYCSRTTLIRFLYVHDFYSRCCVLANRVQAKTHSWKRLAYKHCNKSYNGCQRFVKIVSESFKLLCSDAASDKPLNVLNRASWISLVSLTTSSSSAVSGLNLHLLIV